MPLMLIIRGDYRSMFRPAEIRRDIYEADPRMEIKIGMCNKNKYVRDKSANDWLTPFEKFQPTVLNSGFDEFKKI